MEQKIGRPKKPSLAPSWRIQWSNGTSQQLAVWRYCSRHPLWLRALTCVVMTGIFNMPAWQKTTLWRLPSLFSMISLILLISNHFRTFGDGWKGKFTKMDISSRQHMPFVKPSSPLQAVFPQGSWKHSHQTCLNRLLM